MKYLSLAKGLKTGIKVIDDQHGMFFRQINSFSRHSANEGVSRERAVRLFTFLQQYSVEHFGLEQALMEEYRYPGLAEHQAEHRKLRAYVDQTLAKLPTRDLTADFNLQVNYFLVDWFTVHIRQVDRKMTDFLREIAAKQPDHRLLNLIKGLLPNAK
ncbi:MAG: hypothetical protein A3K19_12275 [Lentisphaerae bacterium RIFOXYB12_FULL_65_16]|nr:MAG: hypothetical protein A3K18_01950 [Lentisphaerae bacterium RIFOXYA12_64_32]OGV86106.1 MAG: hypothetical protein A3K19_12275 [Lentisphaerae bacterium RIFOXYB12_FULL_65_16]